MNYKTIIVDDDTVNIMLVKKILAAYFPQIALVAEAHGVDEAIAAINLYSPELLILDINLGNREVFEIFKEIHSTAQIVFISAESKYAINAFRFDAIDFVLKPIVKEVMISAVSKALKRVQQQKLFNETENNMWGYNAHKSFLTISSLDRYEIVKIKDIMYCSSEGRYTIFHLNGGRELIATRNLADFNSILERYPLFLKISRSQIINFEYVARVNKKDGMHCVFLDGSTVPVARRKYMELNRFLNNLE